MQKRDFYAAGVAVLALAMSACSRPADAPATDAAATAGGFYQASAYNGATVQNEDGVIRVTRAEGEDGAQGVTITSSPVAVTFTVEGRGARVRARQNDQWIDLPAESSNTVMLGRGGATQVRVYSRTAPELVVRVTGVADCSTTACSPLTAAAGEPEEDDTTP